MAGALIEHFNLVAPVEKTPLQRKVGLVILATQFRWQTEK
jgi:hypothetical protein